MSKGVRGKYLKQYEEAMKQDAKSVKNHPSYHEGANDERSSWLASLRRDLRLQAEGHNDSVRSYIQDKIKWGLKRNERYKKNPGGL